MPCDRAFALIKRQLKKNDRVYTVDEYINVIEKSAINPNKLKVTEVDTSMIIDYQNWFPKYFYKKTQSIESKTLKKLGKPKEEDKFLVSKYHYFEFSSEKPGIVTVSEFIGGKQFNFRLRKASVLQKVELPKEKLYTGKIPISNEKMTDLRKLQQYIPSEYESFWDEILKWPEE